MRKHRSRRYKLFYRALRSPFERFGAWLALRTVPALPLPWLLRLARLAAAVAMVFDRRGRRVAAANLRVICGRHLSPRRERIIIRGAYRNMVRALATFFWTTRHTRERLSRIISATPGQEEFLSAHRPAITVSAHIGNFESLPQTCELHGFHITSVIKPVKGRGFTELITKARTSLGEETVPQEGALRGLMKALRKGNFVGLLIDQHVKETEGGVWVDFFGLRVCVSQGPAMLANRFNAPILFSWSRPLKNGGYRCEAGASFMPDGQPPAALTQNIMRAFERVIRSHPSLWCLNYERWRYIPPGEDPARYPFYAKQKSSPATRGSGNAPENKVTTDGR